MSKSHDKLPKFFWIQLALAALVGVVFLVTFFQSGFKHDALEKSSQIEKAEKNLQPIGVVSTSDTQASSAKKVRSGKAIYNASCMACHATGVANAPKLDDKAAWEPRVAAGLDALLNTAIKGKGAMPARGGNPAITDDEIKATVLYMTKTAGFELGEESAKKKESKASQQATAAVPATTIKEPLAPAAPKEPAVPSEMKVAEEVKAADNKEGEKAYKNSCFACHDMGIAGSPKLGDKAAWAGRIATGNEALYAAAIKGKGAMPAKGGNAGLSDEAVTAAVDYMVSKAK